MYLFQFRFNFHKFSSAINGLVVIVWWFWVIIALLSFTKSYFNLREFQRTNEFQRTSAEWEPYFSYFTHFTWISGHLICHIGLSWLVEGRLDGDEILKCHSVKNVGINHGTLRQSRVHDIDLTFPKSSSGSTFYPLPYIILINITLILIYDFVFTLNSRVTKTLFYFVKCVPSLVSVMFITYVCPIFICFISFSSYTNFRLASIILWW